MHDGNNFRPLDFLQSRIDNDTGVESHDRDSIGALREILDVSYAGGRIAALEILIGTPAVRNLIREGKVHQIPSAMQTGQKVGMQTLDMALIELVRRNMVSVEEAQSRTLTPNLFASQAAERPPTGTQPGTRLSSVRS